jgi:hypothetical protein
LRLVLKVSSHNENDDGGCGLALIHLTPQLAEMALRRIATLCAIKAQDEDTEEVNYWNYDVVFFDPFACLGGRQAVSGEELLERLDKSPNDFIEADAAFEIRESQIAAIDCCQMAARVGGIGFVAIPKHACFYVETVEIPREVLRWAASLS